MHVREKLFPILSTFKIDITLFLLAIGISFACYFIPSYSRLFELHDPYISSLHLSTQTVPVPLLILLCGILPSLILFFYEYNRDSSNAMALFGTIFGLILAIIAGNAVTDVLKLSVGRLRPDFLSRCQWNGEQCIGIPAVVAEGRRSFPSGHATIAFAGMSYLAFYIAGRCRLFHKNHMWQTKLIGAISVLVSLTIATCIGYSRVYDHWHYVTDVIMGSGMGILSASCCYIRHFYWITSNYAGISKWSVKKNQKDDELSIELGSYEANSLNVLNS